MFPLKPLWRVCHRYLLVLCSMLCYNGFLFNPLKHVMLFGAHDCRWTIS